MKSLTNQLMEAKQAEADSLKTCEDLNAELYAAEQVANKLRSDLKRASARHAQLRKDRESLEAAIKRERLYQHGVR